MCGLTLVVLAGGFGTRLRHLLGGVPKALAPVDGTPFLEIQIENWLSQGVNSFVFLLHHESSQVLSFLEDVQRRRWPTLSYKCLVEPTPLLTGGSIASALSHIEAEEFLVTNADTWLSAGISSMERSVAPALAAVEVSDASRFGTIECDESGLVNAFVEKNPIATRGLINAGLYKLSSRQFPVDLEGTAFSLEKEMFPRWISARALKVTHIDADFIDIGVPHDYETFEKWYLKKKTT